MDMLHKIKSERSLLTLNDYDNELVSTTEWVIYVW